MKRLKEDFSIIGRKDLLTEKDIKENRFILKVKHKEFIEVCERVIRPYRRLSGQISKWIAVYFACNAIGFTLFVLSRFICLEN